MLQMPRRSVTRFFIPLIDVLTLLFCIFLMMPAVKRTAEAGLPPDKQDLARRERDLKAKEDDLRREIDRVRREATEKEKQATEKVLNNLSTRVFEIDPNTGQMFYLDPDRVNVTDAKQVQDLIRRDRDRVGPGHEVYYVILYPRDQQTGGGVPSKAQKDDYDRWFGDVPHRYDIPWASALGGKQP